MGPSAAELAAARASARGTEGGPAHPAPPGAGVSDMPAMKHGQLNEMCAGMKYNPMKSSEYGEKNADKIPEGTHLPPPSRLPTASSLSEMNHNPKVGTNAKQGHNATNESLDRVRVDDTGCVLTTNQGVKIATNQHTLRAGARGPMLMEDFIMREKITHFDHERIPERVVHARGSAAHGYFESYESLTQYTKAAPFKVKGKKTPVFVRFSTASGERGSKDTARDVRGFAVKFYTDEGNWDLVGNNIPVFFIQDAIKFPDVIHALKPEPHHNMPQASSAHDTFWDFVSLMPESTHMVLWQMSDRAIPRSYRTMQGFGVHTFRLVNEAGEACLVKFHWIPKLGTHSLVWEEAVKIAGADTDFHRRDLWEAIEAGEYPEYELGLQIFTEEQAASWSFDVLDSTKLIPEELVPLKIVGRLVLDRNPDNFFAETEQVAFCTAQIIPGIDFTNDPLLGGRIHSYVDTQLTRLGGPNFHEIPINAAIAQVHNNNRDGFHRQEINRGRVNYEPNSIAGGCPFQAGSGQGFSTIKKRLAHKEAESHDNVRIHPEKFAEHYAQARLFYESQTPVEKAHIADAFRFELSKVTVPAIRERMISSLLNVSPKLAERVAKDLGFEKLPEPMPKAAEAPAKPEIVVSPMLSLGARPGDGSIRMRKIAILVDDGVEGKSISKLVTTLAAAGAIPRLVGSRLRTYKGAGGENFIADATMENSPGFMFDALVLPDGVSALKALEKDLHTQDFVRDQYWHFKPILAFGASKALLTAAQISPNLPDGSIDPGLILAEASEYDDAITKFILAVAQHRHFGRERDQNV
ncbi:hypothetical protein CXG81DRAFT_23617 [Caulochytrium protostelioides]|uniref:Catalase n=1 Tax=Caulochytrium protostelioides TaxID=1555241 RepID=A0A4P9XE57_9FUNG|nr:catalase [Caulochytrium protostelioides]RKP03782.1 hypothetical protein CXG81DRAFT_23617 [Caulochytrium protostelioides]|eukprot:RKP03782.1 hypothetical protein CXG81DRAFT_23617 [Caulochytrium protostelioides]